MCVSWFVNLSWVFSHNRLLCKFVIPAARITTCMRQTFLPIIFDLYKFTYTFTHTHIHAQKHIYISLYLLGKRIFYLMVFSFPFSFFFGSLFKSQTFHLKFIFYFHCCFLQMLFNMFSKNMVYMVHLCRFFTSCIFLFLVSISAVQSWKLELVHETRGN